MATTAATIDTIIPITMSVQAGIFTLTSFVHR
jgi:hypothetical protein